MASTTEIDYTFATSLAAHVLSSVLQYIRFCRSGHCQRSVTCVARGVDPGRIWIHNDDLNDLHDLSVKHLSRWAGSGLPTDVVQRHMWSTSGEEAKVCVVRYEPNKYEDK